MSKYIIKNCPALYQINGMTNECLGTDYQCQDCTDCVLKQIVESFRKTVKIFSAESGTHPYAGGRCTEAEGILQLLNIQEGE